MSDELDPGITEVVRWLNQRHFDTTDSGDGVTKPMNGWTEEDGILLVPHVFIQVSRGNLTAEADRLVRLLGFIGVKFSPIGGDGVHVQATYDPVDNSATIGLFGLNDEMLLKVLKEPS